MLVLGEPRRPHENYPDDKYVFIGGDFNGHIGRDASIFNSVHGGFGLGASKFLS